MGAHLKASFAMHSSKQIYISQYLGNLDSYDAQVQFKKTYTHLCSILKFHPGHIFTDLHPDYFSHVFGKTLASQMDIPITFVQHHKAHFAAVLQENNLINSKDGVLGVIWDGTGYGDDHSIWGGEFFSYCKYQMIRILHLSPFPVILGDKMALEPRISALAFSYDNPKIASFTSEKFTDIEWKIYHRNLENANIKSSSIGRLFDAIASLLGLIDKSTFEGQAAMYLERLACEFEGETHAFPIKIQGSEFPYHSIISALTQDIIDQIPKKEIAYKFHLTLVEMIRQAALESNLSKIAFSGGVFQNQLLIDLIVKKLDDAYELYFHKELSPNDENISFGQLIYGFIEMKLKERFQESLLKSDCYEASSRV